MERHAVMELRARAQQYVSYHNIRASMKTTAILVALCAQNGQAFLFGRVGSITGFTLNSAPDGKKLADLQNGTIYYLNNTNPGLTVVALGTGRIRRVQMGLDTNLKYRTEQKAPYTLCGGFSYSPCPELKPGTYIVTARPRGGTAQKVKFAIVAGFPPGTPTTNATGAPVGVAPVVVVAPVVAPQTASAPVGPLAPMDTVAPMASAAPMAPTAPTAPAVPVAPIAPTASVAPKTPNTTPVAPPAAVAPLDILSNCSALVDTLSYISCITLTKRTLTLNGTTSEDRAVKWLVDTDPFPVPPITETNKTRLRQRFALLTFGFQTVTNTTTRLFLETLSWNLTATANECVWWPKGVACQNGQVTRITLVNVALGGTLPPDLSWLTAMSQVNLQITGMAGTLPSQLGWWTNLAVFDVHSNQLSGTIPPLIGASWTAIAFAYFDNNNFTGIMPQFASGFCPKLGNGSALWADCKNNSMGQAKIVCPCCTTCQ
jgi:hypothetical protein